MKKLLIIAGVLSTLLLLLPLLWCFGLWYYQPISLLPSALLLTGAGIWWVKRRRPSVHFVLWMLVAVNIATYHLLPNPAPERWQKPWAVAPEFEQNGHMLTIRNIRDFRYRTETDSDAHYRTETYDLNKLCGVDFATCHWDGMVAVCHTMLSFQFEDGRRFVISAETRLPEGVAQNSIAGLYKQYGIIYLFGTEEDIFGLRTNIRHEDLSIYPLKINQAAALRLLQHYIRLATESERCKTPYNTVTGNCSTGLVSGFRVLVPHMARKYDFLPLHNGSIAGLLINYGAVQCAPGETPEQIRTRCYVGYDIPLDNYSANLRKIITRQK